MEVYPWLEMELDLLRKTPDGFASSRKGIIEGGSSIIREWTWLFLEALRSFYLVRIMVSFIEVEFFHNKKWNWPFTKGFMSILFG
jgi:hypothetical protein